MKIAILIIASLSLLTGCHVQKFEKIIFHTTQCFGTCPSYHLEIDNDKKISLYAETVFSKDRHALFRFDTTKMGYFTGKVADTSFKKLVREFNAVGIGSLNFDGANCCDGSEITIIAYYDGKRKYLKSMFPPAKAGPLIDILYEICGKSKLQRTDKKFYIEDTSQSQYSPGS